MNIIDTESVMLCIPALDSRNDNGTSGGLASSAAAHLFGDFRFMGGCSDVRLARTLMVHEFLRTDKQWLVFVDSDIGFSSTDLRILLDLPPPGMQWQGVIQPEGTTVGEDGHALIVCAAYSRKVESLDPALFGLGFCRIHRSVFDRLLDYRDDGQHPIERETLQRLLDTGTDWEYIIKELRALLGVRDPRPIVGSFVHKGEIIYDFFPNGPGLNGTWFGEDTGFFHCCRTVGIVPRIEQRTRLLHGGRKIYPFVGGAANG